MSNVSSSVGFDELMDKNSVSDLKKMYNLFHRVDALPKIKLIWNTYIKVRDKLFFLTLKKRGTALITDEENDKSMIEQLLKFKEKLDNILKNSFQQNEELLYSQKEAFEYFINQRQNVPAEMLAKFLDSKVSIRFLFLTM